MIRSTTIADNILGVSLVTVRHLVLPALFLLLLLFILPVPALAGSISSGKIVKNDGHSMIAVSDGYIVAGKVEYEFGSVLYLLKTDLNGSEVWSKTYGEYTPFGEVFGLAAVPDGYVISGTTIFENGTGFYLFKTDLNGNSSWLKTFGEPDRFVYPSTMISTDNGLVLTGSAYPFPRHEDTFFAFGSLSRSFLSGIDKDGNVRWYQTYDGSGEDCGNAVVAIQDGYLVAGTSVVMDLGRSVSFLVKTDPNGRQIWKRDYGGSVDRGEAVVPASDGYLLAGDSGYGYLPKEFIKVSLLKTDLSGNKTWERNYLTGPGGDVVKFTMEATDGYLIVGTSAISSDRNDHSTMLYLLKTDLNGNQAWNKTYPGSSLKNPGAVISLSDGYLIAGPANMQGYWQGYDRKGLIGPHLLKIDLDGNVLWEKTYDNLITREKPVGLHPSPKSMSASPIPLDTASPAPGIPTILSLIAVWIAAMLISIRISSGKRR